MQIPKFIDQGTVVSSTLGNLTFSGSRLIGIAGTDPKHLSHADLIGVVQVLAFDLREAKERDQ